MGLEGSLPYLQEPTTFPYPGQDRIQSVMFWMLGALSDYSTHIAVSWKFGCIHSTNQLFGLYPCINVQIPLRVTAALLPA